MQLDNAVNFIKGKTNGFVPDILLVLGSGLGDFTEGLEGFSIPYTEIEGFVPSTVVGHKGSLFFYSKNGKNIAVMQGRFHFYEGNSMATITYPIKLLNKLGAKTLILTNAAGALDTTLTPGDLMLITDHINLMGTNPLIGKNDDNSGERFPDMSQIYSPELRKLAFDAANNSNIELKEGVYAATTGPSYETPSEVKMLKIMGADVVGMSTAPEAIVANWLKMKVLGISLVSNYASGVTDSKLSHDEVLTIGRIASSKFKKLINSIIDRI